MICNFCQASNSDKTQFCIKCGKQIGTFETKANFMQPPLKYIGPKKLDRSRANRLIAGVCGGIADYYGYDVNLIRLIFIVLFFFGFSGIILYILLIIMIPESQLDPWSE